MIALLQSLCAGALLLHGTAVSAQQHSATYPSKPVRFMTPLGPGNSIEIATRLVAEKLSSATGQPFVIEAQPGAAGQIGTERVARSAADGYTLLSANDGIMTMLPNLQKHVSFDPVRDFSAIAQNDRHPVRIDRPPFRAGANRGRAHTPGEGTAGQARVLVGRHRKRSAACDGFS